MKTAAKLAFFVLAIVCLVRVVSLRPKSEPDAQAVFVEIPVKGGLSI